MNIEINDKAITVPNDQTTTNCVIKFFEPNVTNPDGKNKQC